MNSKFCAYCGSTRSLTREHIIPKSYSGTVSYRSTDLNPMVSACHECNSTLTNVAYHTLESRANYLLGKYKKKYANQLSFPDWTEDELEDMGQNMVKVIKNKMKSKKVIKQRIERLLEVSFGGDILEE